MSNEFVMVRRNVLQDVCSFDDGTRLSAQHAIEALLVKPAEQHQREPVAWRVTGLSGVMGCYVKRPHEWAHGYKIEPLYTHSDPGEVERKLEDQRREFTHAQTVEHRKWADLVEGLRVQIAERDALLREVSKVLDSWRSTDDLEEIGDRIAALISASAEPSAPVEIDERASFEANVPIPAYVYWDEKQSRYLTNCNHSACAVYQGSFEGWKARAALERKPL